MLDSLGVAAGERVFGLMGRQPELYAAILGTLKHRAVFCPLFSAFGPQPVKQRLQLGSGSVLVTTPALYRKKVAPIRDEVPSLTHVLLVGPGFERVADAPGVHNLVALLDAASADYAISPTDPERMSFVHFTSGTTGTPKGAVHAHDAVVAHYATGRYVLGLRERRRLLVHRRPRLGHGHLLRGRGTADLRRHLHRRRGRVRCRALVRSLPSRSA